MAEILNESFATGIPGGFASTINDAGVLVATYNAGDQSVTLTKDAYNAVWSVTALSTPKTVLRVRLDIEHVLADGPGTASGFGISYKFASESFWHSVLVSVEAASISRFNGSGGGAVSATTAEGVAVPYAGQGARHLYEFALVRTVGLAPAYSLRITRDGLSIYDVLLGYPAGTTEGATFGVFMRDSTQKIHSVVVYDDAGDYAPVGLVATPAVAAGAFKLLAGTVTPNPTWSVAPIAAPIRDMNDGGLGRITGTVKEKAAPDNLPLRRRVRLFHETSGRLVRETWSSDAGDYEFSGIDPTQRYTVLSLDHQHAYRAVVADNIAPEAMP